jgi:hypothetical protein
MPVVRFAVAVAVATQPIVRHCTGTPAAVSRGADGAVSQSMSIPVPPSVLLEQVAALPDNPEALRQLLFGIAGPDAVLRVDGFEGAPLPPKDRIRSIQIWREADGPAFGAVIDVRTGI